MPKTKNVKINLLTVETDKRTSALDYVKKFATEYQTLPKDPNTIYAHLTNKQIDNLKTLYKPVHAVPYLSNADIVAQLNNKSLDTGFYRNGKGVVRLLEAINKQTVTGEENVFITWSTEKSGLKRFAHKKASSTISNANYTDVLDWFQNATYLGFTPEEAGLV